MAVIARLTKSGSFQATEFSEINHTNKLSISGVGTVYAPNFNENISGLSTVTTYIMKPFNIIEASFAETPGPSYPKSVVSASLYDSYHIIDDDFVIPSYGIGRGTYMTKTYRDELIVYNEFDEVTQF